MYRTSYYNQSLYNPVALKNSTELYQGVLSKNLKDISVSDEVRYDPVKQETFVSWEKNNKYKTTNGLMNSNDQKLVNVHLIPAYKGFVPRIKSENLFGRNFTKCANFGIRKFDEIRYSGKDSDNYKDWQYNPISKAIGGFKLKNNNFTNDTPLTHHDFTPRLRDSGYSNNHLLCDKKGWTPKKVLHSDQKRTEYRIQYNCKKDFGWTAPIPSTGKLKKIEKNYIHT
eukprot:CAMPEP_0170518192 /NCGR_PEP_ID=MMETSP0209-20121228/3938_1 /TAXON_ID=665100 ORGANISM="Litonotus pictus, Strain P1" /NCGR_SAMPLE_ID=MMETSP0209 /ASSEMBLY_ACC=CAM_ASM_000301 /LENGTH=225 /DNA_ID=CAMNT_0010803659 /DNA_START=114 /DNA_END=791 /DNA_ORIENTATION=-